MRIRFAEEESYPNAAALWTANQERSLKSAKGQAALRRLEAALLALPEKKLVADAIESADGVVCGLGALAKHEGYPGDLALPEPPAEDDDEGWDEWDAEDGAMRIEQAMLDLAKELGVPKLVAIAIIEENDGGGYRTNTPEDRYKHVLAWAQSWLRRDRSIFTEKSMEGYIAE